MKHFLSVACLAAAVSGCGELSYKRGASTLDLEVAKTACRSAGDEKAVEKCLEDQGWTVTKLDDVDLFAVAGVTPDNRNPSVFITPQPVPAVPAAKAAGAAPAEPASATATALSREPGKPPGSVGSTLSTAPTPSPPPPSPLDIYTVSSWWKIGAGREALEVNTGECVARLGETHKPNAKTQQVTRGFVICMHDKGWKALRAVNAG